jgi:hypothetical protein
VKALLWQGRHLLWGTDHVATVEPRPDGRCSARVFSISPRIEPMTLELATTTEARLWVETQVRTLLVLEGHSPDGVSA